MNHRRAGRRLVALGSFALAFALAGSAVRPWVPWPDDMQLRSRFEHLRRHGAAYDAIYFGSSHVYRSFVPAVIDAELGGRGHPLRSFNFGTPGMSVFEMDHLIRSVLDLPSVQPRWVVFEYGFHGFENPDRILSPFNYFTDRAVYWHTPPRTRDVLRTIARSDLAADQRAELGWTHALHAFWRLSSVGQGPRSAAAGAATDGFEAVAAEVERTRGYEPLEAGRGLSSQRDRANFLANTAGYEQQVRSLDAQNRRDHPIADADLGPLRSLEGAIASAGARPLLVVTAFPYGTPGLFSLERSGALPPVIALNSPSRYPTLYHVDRRFDGLHLNERGAREFSAAFADAFADVLDATSER